ncbi:MAG: glycosyltransferase family 39 protein [Chitinispirillaceae bacterium]
MEKNQNDSIGATTLPLMLFAVFAILRLILAIRMPLIPDEAYYWDWTRFLSPGYFDHPPMVAWVAAAGTAVFGDTLLGVHAGPLLLGAGSWILTLLFCRQFCRDKLTLALVLIMMNGTALFGVTHFLLTPDAPQAFFWAAALLTGYHALFKQQSIPVWLLLGVIAGLGLLSKYTFALFLISMAVYLIANSSGRKFLTRPHPYIAFLACLVTYSPNLIWNAQNNWIAVGFQLGHGLRGKGGIRFDYLGDYLAGQAGLLGLFLFIFLIMASIRIIRHERDNPRLMYLFTFYAAPYAFFTLSSLAKRVEANWPGPAHIAAFVTIGWFFEKMRAENAIKRTRFIIASIGFSALLIGLILFHILFPVLPLPSGIDMTKQARGWDQLGQDVAKAITEKYPSIQKPVCANRYQETSLLGFHMPDNPRTWALNLNSRANHYSLLEKRVQAMQDTLFYVYRLSRNLELSPSIRSKFEFLHTIDTVFLNRPPHAPRPYGVYIGRLHPQAVKDATWQEPQ